MYQRLRERRIGNRTMAVQTHRHALAEAKRFLRWCVDRHYLRQNPAAAIKPVGKPKRGKPQLRLDEARQLRDACLAEIAAGDDAALAVLVILLQGLRASEVANLDVRDIDDGGSLLWVADSKTEAGRRVLRVFEPLRSLLAAYAKDRVGRLFPDRNRWWIGYHTRRLCWLAKVPEVPPHGLRGTCATLGMDEGAAAEAVMRALSHTSVEVGRRHYLGPGAADRRQAGRVAQVLGSPDLAGNDSSGIVPQGSGSEKGASNEP